MSLKLVLARHASPGFEKLRMAFLTAWRLKADVMERTSLKRSEVYDVI